MPEPLSFPHPHLLKLRDDDDGVAAIVPIDVDRAVGDADAVIGTVADTVGEFGSPIV
jgi:hypothetical protein